VTLRLRLLCPCCETSLRKVEAMDAATQVISRTCPRPSCRNQWTVVVTPLRVEDGKRLDKLNWIPRGRKS